MDHQQGSPARAQYARYLLQSRPGIQHVIEGIVADRNVNRPLREGKRLSHRAYRQLRPVWCAARQGSAVLGKQGIDANALSGVIGIMDKAERSATHVQDAAVAKTFARLTIAREFRTPVRGYIQIPIGRKRSPSAPKVQFETLRRTPLACCCRNVKSALQSSIMDHPSCTGYRPGVAGHSRTRAGEASSSQ